LSSKSVFRITAHENLVIYIYTRARNLTFPLRRVTFGRFFLISLSLFSRRARVLPNVGRHHSPSCGWLVNARAYRVIIVTMIYVPYVRACSPTKRSRPRVYAPIRTDSGYGTTVHTYRIRVRLTGKIRIRLEIRPIRRKRSRGYIWRSRNEK